MPYISIWRYDYGKHEKTDNTTFAEKHPRLNVLISLLLLLVLVAVIGCLLYGAAKYIIIGTKSGVDWLASLTSKLDAVVIVALITGSVSIIGYNERHSECVLRWPAY